MGWRQRLGNLLDNPIVEWSIFILGAVLLIVSPLVGAIPGPGGIVVAGIGLAMMLKTSMWAKRHYARLKKKSVKIRGHHIVIGEWADWALRRPSAQRRDAIRKARESSSRN